MGATNILNERRFEQFPWCFVFKNNRSNLQRWTLYPDSSQLISSFRHFHSPTLSNLLPEKKTSSKFSSVDAHNNPANDSHEEDNGKKPNSTGEILKRLKKYGMSGILSYGLLNTAYYLPTFLFVWLYVAPAPGKMGYLAAVERFLKTFAMVWAGSQVTKIARAAGALALAPIVERGLSWFTVNFKFESQGKAFMVIVGFCFGLAFLMFILLTLLWA